MIFERQSALQRWAFLLGLLVLITGCSGRSGRIPISGTVTVDGEPGSLATLIFWPEKLDIPGTSGGSVFTNDKGEFVSGDKAKDSGFLPGEYKVTVSRFVDRNGKATIASGKKTEADLEVGVRQSIPEIYLEQTTTPLSARVAANTTTFNFAVKVKDP